MHPKLRNALIAGGGVLVAIMAGWQIANESYFLVGALGSVAFLWLASRAVGIPADTLLLGLVLMGYLIGNRGFAQLNVPRLPLLPGELALGVGLVMALWVAAREKFLPIRRDLLNFVLLAWLVFGALRLRFDLRAHGFVALRDFAILYYALFFFLAQGWWHDPVRRRWIERSLSIGFAVGAPVFILFARWPDFFVRNLAVRGVPLIYVKSDVQAGLLVAGTFWFLHRYLASRKIGYLLLGALNLLGVVLANSRAALVAMAVTGVVVLLCRHWRLLRPILLLGGAGTLVLLASPWLGRQPLKQSFAYRLYETGSSIFDVSGSRTYDTADLGDKPDNNRFRLTWWKTVIDQTWSEGAWLGMGFGYDLSDQFVRVYYTEGNEDFTARSPHNFPLTVFGRMGLAGVAFLAVFLASFAARAWRAGRRAARDPEAAANEPFTLWIGAWGIFVSACFGVVLEGPMGAAVFWTLLGMANAASAAGTTAAEPRAEEAASPGAEPFRPALRS